MKLFIFMLLFAGLYCRRFLQEDLCPGSATNYKIHAIDATLASPATLNATGCYFKLYLSTGECSLTTDWYQEATPGYICFSKSGPACAVVANDSLIGFSSLSCNGTLISEPISFTGSYSTNQEIEASNMYLTAKVAIGHSCNPATNDPNLPTEFIQRACSVQGPAPVAEPPKPTNTTNTTQPNNNTTNPTNNTNTTNTTNPSNNTNNTQNNTNQNPPFAMKSSAISLEIFLASILVLVMIIL